MSAHSDTSHDGDASREQLRRVAAGVLTVVALVVLISPVFRRPVTDSFPLSTFPMFSSLIEPEVRIDYVVGVDVDGNDVRLSPEVIAGTDEVIIAGSIVSQAVRRGSDAVEGLCSQAAARVRNREIITVEVRTDSVDAIQWFSGESSPLASITHGVCDVS